MTRNNTQLQPEKAGLGDASPATDDYRVHFSTATLDPEWDAFVASTPEGRHTQSSLWAQVKAFVGWKAVRVIVTERNGMVGGAQILLRRLPVGGYAAYIPRGPVLARDDPTLAELLVSELRRFASAAGVQYLAARPPIHYEALADQLDHSGFRPSLIEIDVEPVATVLVDLTVDPDEMLARMATKTRYNIRLGLRKGIVIREGGEADLTSFYHLLLKTGERQAFSTNALDYHVEVWRAFSPHGHMKLFLAEVDGEIVSGLLAIPFGDRVIYWRGAWSGHHGNLHPNEAMQWTAMMWAKSHEYRYYDLEGIDQKIGEAIVRGEPLPKGRIHPLTSYKLGFGGQVVLLPGLYDYVPNSLLRWGYRVLFSRIPNQPVVARAVSAARGLKHR